MLKVLVTGAGGYLGKRLVSTILGTDNVQVTATIRPGGDPGSLEDLGARVVSLDLSKRQDMREILDGVECIYHLAAGTSGSH